MKRLALALAATAFLGTGCFVSDGSSTCSRSLTLQWDFMDFDGAIRGCSASLRQTVDSVDVWVNGNRTSFDCFAGTGTVGIGSGTTLVTVEGISGGQIAYRHEFSISPTCGDQLVAVRPAQGTLSVAYRFFPTNLCASPPTYVWISVRDEIAATTQVFNGTGSREVCSTTLAPPVYVLPAGTFTFEGAEEVSVSGLTVSVLANDCTTHPFDIAGAAVTTVSPVLLDSSAACF